MEKSFQSLCLAFGILVLLVSVEIDAQSRWLTFSPPDRSFSIKLPRKPAHVHGRLNYETQGLFEGNFGADTYDFSPNDSGTVAVVSVFHLTTAKSLRQFNKESDSVMLVIGGDDKEFDKQTSVIINGLHAREYFYRKGDIRGRVLIVNAGKRIYFLQYHCESGALPDFVDRIFRSFRITGGLRTQPKRLHHRLHISEQFRVVNR